jgi:hypothetical protein
MPSCTCYPRVGCLLDPDLCCSCVGRSSPASRRVGTPDPALSHRHARLPAARRPAAVGTRRSVGHPVLPPRSGRGMTHRDEQSMRWFCRWTKITRIPAEYEFRSARSNAPSSARIFAGSGGMVGGPPGRGSARSTALDAGRTPDRSCVDSGRWATLPWRGTAWALRGRVLKLAGRMARRAAVNKRGGGARRSALTTRRSAACGEHPRRRKFAGAYFLPARVGTQAEPECLCHLVS